jgi:preprotein translocase SecE subunit
MAAETKKSEEKDIKEKESGGNFIDGIRSYLSDVRTELNKVSWPSREDVIRLTRIVLATITVASITLGVLSITLSYLLDDAHFTGVLDAIHIGKPLFLAVLFIAIIGVTWWSFRQDANKSY